MKTKTSSTPTGTLTLPHRYYPRSYQAKTFGAFQSGITRFMDIEHRRAGKSRKWLNIQIWAGFKRIGTYCYILPELKQAREVIWEGIGGDGMRYLDHFPEQWLYREPNKAELSVTLRNPYNPSQPGSRFILLGTDRNINAVVGMNPIGIVWDEWAMQDPQARRFARPILAENGGWEAICFTPRGENHAYELHEAVKDDPLWYVQRLTVDDTRRDAPHESGGPVVDQAMIDQDRREGVDEATIEQEYYLSWQAPMPGSYYAKEMRLALDQGRICELPHDSTRRVHTCWDFGSSKAHDTNSIWFFQMVGRMVHWIDYEQHSNEGIDFFVRMLESKPYVYGSHFAMETDLDEADIKEGVARQSHFQRLGIEFTAVPKLRLIDGINDVRIALARSRFDAEKCRDGINGLRSYRREWNEKMKRFDDHPVHDWASHPEAGFRYGSVAILELDDTPWQKEARAGRPAHGNNFNPMSRW